MATFITKTFLTFAIAFFVYAIWNRPHEPSAPAGDRWSWMRHADVEDRRQDLQALSEGLSDEDQLGALISTTEAEFNEILKNKRPAK